MVRQKGIIDLTEILRADGILSCTLPAGDWTVIHFGMITIFIEGVPIAKTTLKQDVSDAIKAGENQLQVLVTSTSTDQPKLGTSVQLKTIVPGR